MDRFVMYNPDPASPEMFLRPSMAELVKRAREGEVVIILYPSVSKTRHAFLEAKKALASQLISFYEQDTKAVFPSDGILRVIFWRSTQSMDHPEKLLGLDATFVFSKKAFFSASREMHRLAHERAIRAYEK